MFLKCSIDTLSNKILLLNNMFGYSKKDIIKIGKYFPQIYWYAIDNIEKRIVNLVLLGYTREEVIKITRAFPKIYSLGIDNIKDTIDGMINLGYSNDEVLVMTKRFPSLYSFSIDTIKLKMDELMSLGYDIDDVKKMTVDFSGLYGFSIESLREKKEFYDLIGIGDIFRVSPKMLMQSISVSYARYMFYKDNGIDINMSNYNMLFVGQKQFENKYKITKEELINLYSYDSYVDKDKKKVVGGIYGK